MTDKILIINDLNENNTINDYFINMYDSIVLNINNNNIIETFINKQELKDEIKCYIINFADKNEYENKKKDIILKLNEFLYGIPLIANINNIKNNIELLTNLINTGNLFTIIQKNNEEDIKLAISAAIEYYNRIKMTEIDDDDLNDFNIIYCDDEIGNIDSFKANMRKYTSSNGYKYQIFTADSVDECLEKISNIEFSAVISDNRKQGSELQGYHLFHQVFNINPKISRICYSASASENSEELFKLIEKGKINKIVSKPHEDLLKQAIDWGVTRYNLLKCI